MNSGVGIVVSCLRSFMRQRSQMASLAASVEAMYSASVEDWDMLDWSLELQEIGPPARRKIALEMDQRELGSMV